MRKVPFDPVIAVTVLNVKTKMRGYIIDTFLTEVELCRNTLIILAATSEKPSDICQAKIQISRAD